MNTPETKEETERKFRRDLADLLGRYVGTGSFASAYIEAADHYPGYPECGQDIRMTVTIPGIYDDEGNILREWTEINLGSYFQP